MVKKDFWRINKRIELKYETLLASLLKPIKKEVMKNAGDVSKIKQILYNAANSKLFNKKADEIANKIVTLVWENNAKDWKEAAKKSSKGAYLNKLLKEELKGEFLNRYNELIQRNAEIIKTLPLEISKNVVKHVESKSLSGERHEDIAKEIKEFFPTHTKAKQELIARTESSKCKTALTQVRSEELGLDWYVWKGSLDQRERASHKNLENVIVNYKHPPEPEVLVGEKSQGRYNAGEIYNCRCYAAPLIRFDEVSWPSKVYNWKTNKIEKMTLAKFKEFGGNEFNE